MEGEPVDAPQALIEQISAMSPGDEITLLVEGMDGLTFEVTVVLGENETGGPQLGVALLNNAPATEGEVVPGEGDPSPGLLPPPAGRLLAAGLFSRTCPILSSPAPGEDGSM